MQGHWSRCSYSLGSTAAGRCTSCRWLGGLGAFRPFRLRLGTKAKSDHLLSLSFFTLAFGLGVPGDRWRATWPSARAHFFRSLSLAFSKHRGCSHVCRVRRCRSPQWPFRSELACTLQTDLLCQLKQEERWGASAHQARSPSRGRYSPCTSTACRFGCRCEGSNSNRKRAALAGALCWYPRLTPLLHNIKLARTKAVGHP